MDLISMASFLLLTKVEEPVKEDGAASRRARYEDPVQSV